MRAITFFLICFVGGFSIAQNNSGYLGKKIIIDVNARINTPIFRKQFNLLYLNDAYIVKQRIVDLGIRIDGYYLLRRNFMVGFELGLDNFKIDPEPNSISPQVFDPSNIAGFNELDSIEAISCRLFTFGPRIEFTTKGGLLPMGIGHQIGLNYFLATPSNGQNQYGVVAERDQVTGQVIVSNKKNIKGLIDPNITPVSGLNLNYTLNARYPINDWCMINAGIRYGVSFFIDSKRSQKPLPIENSDYFLSKSSFERPLSNKIGSNLISLTIGLAFSL